MSNNIWDKLRAAGDAAARQGEWKRANELWGAAREAWENTPYASDIQAQADKQASRGRKAKEDYEYEKGLERGRGR